jgi:hypothetical protein
MAERVERSRDPHRVQEVSSLQLLISFSPALHQIPSSVISIYSSGLFSVCPYSPICGGLSCDIPIRSGNFNSYCLEVESVYSSMEDVVVCFLTFP